MVLALTVALVAPYFIDWNHYRDAFEREAGRVLGREVQVEGTAHARLLPFPSVTFTDVVVAGEAPGEPAMTVEEFSMDAELAPFLRGEVLIFDMRLVRPSARVALAADGGIDWAVRPSSRFDPRQVTLENVTITDGSVELFHGTSGRTHRLTHIDASLSAQGLAGPWRFGGALELDGTPLNLTVSTGSANPDGTMRIRLEAQPQNHPVKLAADGQASLEEGAPRYAGTFTLNTYRQEELEARRNGENAAQGPATATNRIIGVFGLQHERLQIEEFRFETGPPDAPYHAEGEAMIELGAAPSFFVRADGAQLRFEPEPGDGEQASAASLEQRFNQVGTFLADLPSPAIPGRVEINLPAIVAGQTTIRNIGLQAEPVENGWMVEQAAATLPGRTRFEAEGHLTTRHALAFEGSMLLAIRQPSGFAAWLAKDVDDAIRRLPSAGFSADVTLSPERQNFSGLELALGEARLAGDIERLQTQDARPSLAVALEGGALDMEAIEALAALFVSDEGANRFPGHDVDFDIKAGPVSVEGMQAEEFDTALRLRGDTLEIDRLTVGGLARARLSATGEIADFADKPTGRIDATILSVDLAPLFNMLSGRFPENAVLAGIAQRAGAYPGLFAESEINLFASAADNGDGTASLAISAEGVTGGTDLSVSLSGSGPREEPLKGSFKSTLTARNDDAAALYGLAGLPALPLGLAGEAQAEISAEGTLTDRVATSASLSGDGLQADFDGTLALTSDAPSLEGRVRLSSDDIEPWMAVAGVALPGFGFGLPVDLSADVEWSEKLAVLSGVTGTVAEGDMGGDLNVSLANGKPHLEGALNLAQLDLAPAAELVLGTGVFSDEGQGPWPETPFSPDVAAPLSADLALDVGSLWAGYWHGGDNASLRLRLDDEGLTLSDLSADLYGGRVEGLVSLKNNGGTGLLSAQLALKKSALNAVLPGSSLTGTIDTSTSVTASGKSVGSLASSLAGAGSASVEDLTVNGFNPHALASILGRADEIGNEIDAAQTAAFAPQIVRNGRFEAGAVEFAFSVANGVARVPPLHLQADGATLVAEAAADLRSLSVEASGSISYEAGKEAVVGSEPAVRFDVDGPLGATETGIDSEPMAQYLTQRALEREQARVERMQSVLLEKQRLRREAQYYAALNEERDRAEAEEQRLQLELMRQREREERARMEAARRAEEEARRQEEARRLEEARRQEEEARRLAEEQRQREEAAARTQQERLDSAGQGDPDTIERAPLPPPSGLDSDRDTEGAAPNSRDAVEDFFRAKDLSVDRLLELIGPEDPQ